MKPVNIVKLVVSCAVPFLVGLMGSLFTTADSLGNWYANLHKPAFNPPNWVFGPVWTTLYIMMGIAAFLVWRKGLENKLVRLALVCFIVQLFLNAIWTPLFFGLRSPLAGLIDIVLLLSAIDLTVILFLRISKPAALLLVPYVLWVLFATILNASIYLLNR
ncbi:MAG: TspO/MBR family protein [Sedimentisphaerales bacterium]|jgi:tryptophan-rich sensory protein